MILPLFHLCIRSQRHHAQAILNEAQTIVLIKKGLNAALAARDQPKGWRPVMLERAAYRFDQCVARNRGQPRPSRKRHYPSPASASGVFTLRDAPAGARPPEAIGEGTALMARQAALAV